MMLWNILQVFKKYPYLVPALLLILLLWVAGWCYQILEGIFRAANCPDCDEDKLICIVACERVSHRLALVDEEMRKNGRLGSN